MSNKIHYSITTTAIVMTTVVYTLVGDHCGVLIGDAFQKGLMKDQSDEIARNAYNAMRKNALEIPSGEEYLEGKGRRAIKEYLTAGFVPLEATMPLTFHSREQVIERYLFSALSILLRSNIVCISLCHVLRCLELWSMRTMITLSLNWQSSWVINQTMNNCSSTVRVIKWSLMIQVCNNIVLLNT